MNAMKFFPSLLVLAWIGFPDFLLAAPADGSVLVFVADTRRIEWALLRYLAHLYNTNIDLFALWVIVLASFWGSALGWLADRIMQSVGLDLKNRTVAE